MAVWVALALSIVGLAVAIILALHWSRRSRVAQDRLLESRQAVASLHDAVADLQRQIDVHQRELVTRPPDPEQAVLITSLGATPSRRETTLPALVLRPTVAERLSSGAESGLARFLARPSEGTTLGRRVVDRIAVRAVSLGFGVAHALRPEVRDRIEFAARAGMRRSRRRREHELRLARRLVRSGRVVSEER
jgi:hypothetical protein